MVPPPPASAAETVSPKTHKGIAEWPSRSAVGIAETTDDPNFVYRSMKWKEPGHSSPVPRPEVLSLTALTSSSSQVLGCQY